MERIAPLLHSASLAEIRATTARRATAGPSFSDRFREALVEANRSLQNAERSAQQLAAGKADVVETTIALSHAELSLRHVAALRNRVLEAYQEIMRLQL